MEYLLEVAERAAQAKEQKEFEELEFLQESAAKRSSLEVFL